MTDERTKRAITYGFLAQTKNSMVLRNGILDVFIPLVKKGMSHYCSIYKGEGGDSIDEIGKVIKEDNAIDIPHSVLRVLLERIEKEVGDSQMFKLHGDDSFLLKSYLFSDFEVELQQVREDVKMIQEMYEQFCTVYEYNIEIVPSVNDFIDNNRLALSSYISNLDGLNGNDFTAAAQFVEFCRQIPYVYQLLCNQYLGSVITCFLEFKPKKAEMGVDLLFDTNFIISLFDLNTEASTKTCTKLLELSKSMGYTHHILKDTIEETQALLYFKSKHYEEAVVYKYINKEDVFSACERLKINGTDLERIADNLETEIQKRGINIVYHTDDLTGKARYSTEYEILKSKRNTAKAALHDAKAIYYVKGKRKKTITDFEQVNCWFVNNTITHDSDSESIDALLDKERKNGMPEIIRADDLLNILWLSNPQIDISIANNELSDIGLTSLVSITLNKNLPKARIIRTLDENIQKYRTEDVTDRDVLMLSARIVNHHLNSEEVEALNRKAQKDRAEFSRRIKEEAAKEEAVQRQRNDKINEIVTTWQINWKDILKGRLEIVKTVKDDNLALQEANKQKDAEITRLKEARIKQENNIRKEKREEFKKEALKKWRKWPSILLWVVIILFLLGVIWLVLLFGKVPVVSEIKFCKNIVEDKSFAMIFTFVMAIINGIVIKAYYDRNFSSTSINSFVDHLVIPEEFRELKTIDELE